MKNILITGGAGFIGVNLVKNLLKKNSFKLTILDNLSTGNLQVLQEIVSSTGKEIEYTFSPDSNRVCFYKGDICTPGDVEKALENQHGAIHLAAQTGVIPSVEDPIEDARINIMGTLNLLRSSVLKGIQRFIFASSAAPLGEQIPPLDENKIPKPLSPYGSSKLAGEGYCSAFYASYGLKTTVLRFSNVYGPYSFHKGSVVAEFIKRILKNKPLTIYGDGNQTRDFLYIDDLASAVIKILESPSENTDGETFQLGSGTETSVNDLIELLKDITGLSIDTIFEPPRKGEINRNYTSIEKIKKHIGYTPTFPIRKGLENTWKWFKRA